MTCIFNASKIFAISPQSRLIAKDADLTYIVMSKRKKMILEKFYQHEDRYCLPGSL